MGPPERQAPSVDSGSCRGCFKVSTRRRATLHPWPRRSAPSRALPSRGRGWRRARTSAARARVTLRCDAGRCGIDSGDDGSSRGHGLLHVQGQVADEGRLHGQLPVGELLDQHGLEQRLVGLLDGDDWERAQGERRSGSATASSPGGAREVSSIDMRRSRARLAGETARARCRCPHAGPRPAGRPVQATSDWKGRASRRDAPDSSRQTLANGFPARAAPTTTAEACCQSGHRSTKSAAA